MKAALKFNLIYSGISILLLILMQIILGILTMETFSFAIWLYIFYLIIGIGVFPLWGLLTDRFQLSSGAKLVWYAILILFILNSIPFFDEGKIITLEAIKGLLGYGQLEVVDIGVHLISIIGFVISYLICFRKGKAWQMS
jgi:hypothetical protein